jgi:hypothetical protein
VVASSVVAPEPGCKCCGAFVVRGEGLPVGPFGLQGPVEAFDFPVLPGHCGRMPLLREARITTPVSGRVPPAVGPDFGAGSPRPSGLEVPTPAPNGPARPATPAAEPAPAPRHPPPSSAAIDADETTCRPTPPHPRRETAEPTDERTVATPRARQRHATPDADQQVPARRATTSRGRSTAHYRETRDLLAVKN